MIVKKTCHNSIQINQWLCSTVLKIPFNEQIKVPNQTSLQAFGSGCKRQPATTPTTQVGKKKKNGNSSDSHDPRSGKRKKKRKLQRQENHEGRKTGGATWLGRLRGSFSSVEIGRWGPNAYLEPGDQTVLANIYIGFDLKTKWTREIFMYIWNDWSLKMLSRTPYLLKSGLFDTSYHWKV